MKQIKTITILLASFALSACAVGPDFNQPETPKTKSYSSKDIRFEGKDRFINDGDIPAAWWELFKSASLNHVIDRAIKANPTLGAAKASLLVAKEKANAGYGGFFPSISGNVGANRSKLTTSSNPYTLYNATVNVSYSLDVFGGIRRSVESLNAKTEASRFELEAAYLTLTSNVVTSAIQEASLRAQIKATKKIISMQEKQLKIMKAKLDVGAIAKQEYLAQKTVVAMSKTSLPALENSFYKTRTLLSVLMGQLPSKKIGVEFTLDSFNLPKKVPLSLPSKLVKQRPDVRASLARLHDASAQIGIAKAAMLPQFPLTGNYGISVTKLADMFSPTTALWGIGAGLVQPIFQGGSLLHQKRATQSGFDVASSLYRHTVLSAFKDVADALTSLESNDRSFKAELNAKLSAQESFKLASEQYNVGAISYSDLLNAQISYQKAEIGLIKAKANRLLGTATLLQALGGGWWNRNGDI